MSRKEGVPKVEAGTDTKKHPNKPDPHREDLKNLEINQQIVALARASGCKAKWCDCIFGYAWHCMCPGDDHACDEQCSDITMKSAQLALDRMNGARPKDAEPRPRPKDAGK